MDEKDIVVDACYVIGTILLFKNQVTRELLDNIYNKLSVYYELDLSEGKIKESVMEWRDFFRFDNEGNVILTKESLLNKNLIRYIFSNSLEKEIYQRLVSVILNKPEKNNVKSKSIKFPI